MNIFRRIEVTAGRPVPGLVAAALLAGSAFGAPAAASSASAALNGELSRAAVTTLPAYTVDEAVSAKTHTLFMGADIAINLDRGLYGVRDVWGSNWVVDINGREKEISARQAPLSLKITPSLKLTESSVTIVGFRRLQTYSYANDPSVMLTRGLSQSASISNDLRAVAQNAQHRLDVMTSNNMGAASLFAGSDDQFSTNAMLATAEYVGGVTHPGSGLAPSNAAATASSNTTGSFSNEASRGRRGFKVGIAMTAAIAAATQTQNNNEPGKIATSGLDAMDVEFDVRSAKPLHNPYVVTMTRFHVSGSKPGVVQDMVYAQSLHPIDEHLSHVHFVEEGFPFNYELVDFQLHLYNRGEEVATNIAADRVELTRDEAFEYVKMEYIGAHPKGTLPATPAMARLPADLPTRLERGDYAQAFYVKVSKTGLSEGAYSDQACTRRIGDVYLDSVVKRVRFKPALVDGKPIDGVAELKLSQLAL